MNKIGAIVVALSFLATSGGAWAAGDASKGKRIFNRCKACHALEEGKKRIGPSLYGLFGRTSGTAAGYSYSSAMKKAKIVWSEKTLNEYLAAPRKVVKGTKMAFPGLKKKEDRENVIAYLKEATKPK